MHIVHAAACATVPIINIWSLFPFEKYAIFQKVLKFHNQLQLLLFSAQIEKWKSNLDFWTSDFGSQKSLIPN